jgi:sugar phosphate permease
MQGLCGYSSWRWIFIIEGLLSIALAIPAKFVLADWPEQAKLPSCQEKDALQLRNSQDVGGGAMMERLDSAAWAIRERPSYLSDGCGLNVVEPHGN